MNRKLNVYLYGNKTGELSEDELLQLSFRYDDGAVGPLSIFLPIREESYHHASAFPFFENLTPEGDAFEILSKDHVSGNKTFSFLDRFGGDCAGAVSFFKTDQDINKEDNLQEISSDKLAQIIDNLPEEPLLTGIENPPRLSLAGAQSKFAVHKSGGKYYRSNDAYPTTHIIKISNKRFSGLLNNELFCMKLANRMKFNVPEVELKEADGRSYIEIERYDRYVENGVVCRLHQEDFCQALGVVSQKKYQAGGGVKLKDCYRVINDYSNNRLKDIMRFVEWIIFNYLIGNTDAHAKNLSLLHVNGDIKLAPFYDLLSTEVYPEKVVDHNMAMLINGKGKYNSLKREDFSALFKNLGLNATNMMKTAQNRFADFVPIADDLRKSLQKDMDINIFDKLFLIIEKRASIICTNE